MSFGSPRLRLFLLALLSEGIYLALLSLPATNGWPALVFVALFAALFLLYALAARQAGGLGGADLWFVLLPAILFRLTLLPAGLDPDLAAGPALLRDLEGRVTYDTFLLYDQDIWRYLWEGHVWASGFNPYRHAPSAPELDRVVEGDPRAASWEEIRERVSYPELPALYPPLAQLAFRLSHALFPASVLAWKVGMVLAEAGAAFFVGRTLLFLGQPLAPGLLLFAWNPLLVKVFAGSGHYDALVVLALAALMDAAVRGRRVLAYPLLALAVAAKFVPGVLLPLLPFEWSGLALAGGLLVVSVLPFWSAFPGALAGTAATFARGWRFNGGLFLLLERLLGTVGAQMAYIGVVLALVYAFYRRRGDAGLVGRVRDWLWLLGLVIVLGPVVHPWYVAWLLPMAALSRDRTWLVFSGLVFMAFFVMFDGVERGWILSLEYLGLVAVAFWDHMQRKDDLCEDSAS